MIIKNNTGTRYHKIIREIEKNQGPDENRGETYPCGNANSSIDKYNCNKKYGKYFFTTIRIPIH